jgi:hypothetical protein
VPHLAQKYFKSSLVFVKFLISNWKKFIVLLSVQVVHGAVREGVPGDPSLHELPDLPGAADAGHRPTMLQGTDHRAP